MASTSDNRLSSLVVCIIGSYEGGLGFKSDTETESPECVSRGFSQNIQPSTRNRSAKIFFFVFLFDYDIIS